MKMKVTRAFLMAGKRQEIGDEIDVDDRGLAGMLIHEGKAAALTGDVGSSSLMTTETTASAVAGKEPAPSKKGAPHE